MIASSDYSSFRISSQELPRVTHACCIRKFFLTSRIFLKFRYSTGKNSFEVSWNYIKNNYVTLLMYRVSVTLNEKRIHMKLQTSVLINIDINFHFKFPTLIKKEESISAQTVRIKQVTILNWLFKNTSMNFRHSSVSHSAGI